MEKILTIVIPTYNMQDYLHRCLSSLVVEETLMNSLEVLIVNDGSKDNSSQIAHEYQIKFPKTFRVIDKENGNYGSCINTGLYEAKGKYIKILDADDWFDNVEFSLYLNFLINSKVDVDMILTSYTKRYANNQLLELIEPKQIQYNHIYYFSKFDFEKNKCVSMVVMHSITYRTDLLRNNNYYQDTGISFTDMEYDMIPMLYLNNFIFANFNLYQYYLGREGQTVSLSVSSRSLEAYLKIYDRLSFTYKMMIETKESVRVHNARIVFYNLLSSLFFVALYFEKKEKMLDNKLHEIYYFLQENDSILLSKLRKIHPYHIPIFLIWEKTNLFSSNRLLHRIINLLKSIKVKVRL